MPLQGMPSTQWRLRFRLMLGAGQRPGAGQVDRVRAADRPRARPGDDLHPHVRVVVVGATDAGRAAMPTLRLRADGDLGVGGDLQAAAGRQGADVLRAQGHDRAGALPGVAGDRHGLDPIPLAELVGGGRDVVGAGPDQGRRRAGAGGRARDEYEHGKQSRGGDDRAEMHRDPHRPGSARALGRASGAERCGGGHAAAPDAAARHVIAARSGHYIHLDQPRLVTREIHRVVRQVRSR